MLARTESIALVGTSARPVCAEVHVAASGVPGFSIVGLPAKSVRESEQRTHAAIEASGFQWPKRKMVANLAPGGLRKEGTHFDLPIALGVLRGSEQIQADLGGWIFLGELGLDGSTRPVRGALPAAIACRRMGRRGLALPAPNAPEAAAVEGIEVVPVDSLARCVAFLRGEWAPEARPVPVASPPQPVEDVLEVRGHASAKRALEIAAAGGHNLLLMKTLDGGSARVGWNALARSAGERIAHSGEGSLAQPNTPVISHLCHSFA